MIEEVVAVGGNRKNTIKIYDEVEKPLGVVLIIHGMQEHSGRYEWFCSKLNKAGYIAVTSDLRGHGKNMVISDSSANLLLTRTSFVFSASLIESSQIIIFII